MNPLRGIFDCLTGLGRMDRGILLLLLLFGVLTPLALTPWIHGNDGAGYYSYLHTVFIDRDLNFQNEYEHFSQIRTIQAIDVDPVTGKYFSQYPLGTAL